MDERITLRVPCLVLDHDDTTVNSTATVHYPCFVEYMQKYFPNVHLTLEEYFNANFDPGVVKLFTEICGMTVDQMLDEEAYWKEYTRHHIPVAYGGIREILANRLPEPDLVFGWEYPPEQRKPSPWPLQQIMSTWGFRPEELLVVDDLKPGYDMAKAVGVPFAAAGWANDIEKIETFMRANCGLYFKKVEELYQFLFADS